MVCGFFLITIVFCVCVHPSRRNSNCMPCVRVYCITIVYSLLINWRGSIFFHRKKCRFVFPNDSPQSLCVSAILRISHKCRFESISWEKKQTTTTIEWMSLHWYLQFIRYISFVRYLLAHIIRNAINTNKSIYNFLSLHFLFHPEVCLILITRSKKKHL